MLPQLSTLWNKNLRTRFCHSMKLNWKSSSKTKKITNHKKSRKSSKANQSPILNLMTETKIVEIGDPKISWSEGSISWKGKKKKTMKKNNEMVKSQIKKKNQRWSKKKRKGNPVTICQTFIKRKKLKLSQLRKLNQNSEILLVLFISLQIRTNERNIWITWTKSSHNLRIIRTLKNFHSYWLTFQLESKFSDKWRWLISSENNGQPFISTLIIFIKSSKNPKKRTYLKMFNFSTKILLKKLPLILKSQFIKPFKRFW